MLRSEALASKMAALRVLSTFGPWGVAPARRASVLAPSAFGCERSEHLRVLDASKMVGASHLREPRFIETKIDDALVI